MNYLNPNLFGATKIDLAEIFAVARVLRRRELFRFHEDGSISENEHFERELGDYLNCNCHVVAVSSGTAGLRASLSSIGIQRGDSVGVSSYTFIATANAILSLGAWPIPIDINEKLGMDCEDLEKKLPKLTAVIPVYTPGHSSNVPEVVKIASIAGVPVVEDACQALGVQSDGRFAGTIGTLGVYSFQQNKQLAAGEGGAVVSSNSKLVANVRKYTDHGAVRLNARPDWNHEDADIGDNL